MFSDLAEDITEQMFYFALSISYVPNELSVWFVFFFEALCTLAPCLLISFTVWQLGAPASILAREPPVGTIAFSFWGWFIVCLGLQVLTGSLELPRTRKSLCQRTGQCVDFILSTSFSVFTLLSTAQYRGGDLGVHVLTTQDKDFKQSSCFQPSA